MTSAAASCLETYPLSGFQVFLGWFLLAGTALSFLPIELKIILSRSSAGISIGNIAVFSIQAFAALGSALVLLWQSRVGCCFWREPRWSRRVCANNLVVPAQYLAMVLSFLFIFVLYLVFHTRRRGHPATRDETTQPLLARVAHAPDPHAGIQHHPYDEHAPPASLHNSESFGTAGGIFCGVVFAIVALGGGAGIVGWRWGVESEAFRRYGFALGVLSALGQFVSC
eukprot:a513273_10.p1 GENE.a513273_10~~a513273_10.p1  ORF type:complete len:236 (+),score=61.95 a513273_10:33-710(+)